MAKQKKMMVDRHCVKVATAATVDWDYFRIQEIQVGYQHCALGPYIWRFPKSWGYPQIILYIVFFPL